MTRFAWLQSRTQTLVVAALLAALAVIAAVTGVQLSHLFHSTVAHCTSGCGFALDRFFSRDSFLDHALDILARAVPALLGMFWGAPLLARELETGTYRLAWTQSVSRARWLVTRLAVVGFATVAIAGLLTLTITWWYTSRDQAGGTSPFAVFDRRDVAPIAYAAFAFAVGVLLGAVIRRTVPAMAATLSVFVFVRIAVSLWVRPYLLSPLHTTTSLLNTGQFGIESSNGSAPALVAKGDAPHGAWTITSHLVDSSGHVATLAERSAFVKQFCPQIATPPPFLGPGPHKVQVPGDIATAMDACRQHAAQTFHLAVSYQPLSRYWTFQWMELGIFVVLAIAALVGCYFWVTRRVA